MIAGTMSYAFALEPGFRMMTCEHKIKPTSWPSDFQLRIVALADPHIGEPYMSLDRLERIVEKANALKPDLIVLLGDYVAGHRFISKTISVRDAAKVFAQLKSPLGTYAILGNHDWWDDPRAQQSRQGPVQAQRDLEAEGIPVLENDALKLHHKGSSFWLLGLGDQYAFPDQRQGYIGRDNLPGLMNRITDDDPAILLAHEPDIFPEVSSRIALTMSGHTHGGQVRLFGYSPIVPSKYGNRYAHGHIVEKNCNLVVSGGLGCSILPIRFGIPPEITVVNLG
ncbi:metallophosphoesterase [Kiloniella sp.]|uniref:metallophosphoesterase n=1 Tax=Kiloniella sp. TaxID=1938587 RepID=UPI003B010533